MSVINPPITLKGSATTALIQKPSITLPYKQVTDINGLSAAIDTGNINLIQNSLALGTTVPFTTYKDAAGSTPVDGTGGSPTVTIVRNTTTPIGPNADFLFDKPTGDYQGEGFAVEFSLDTSMINKEVLVSFDFTRPTGNRWPRVFIYDITAAALIPLTDNDPGSAAAGTFVASFKASTNKDYRLIFHVHDSIATAYTFYIINLRVGPQFPRQEVICQYQTNSGQAVTNGNTILYEDLVLDTHSAYNTATGEFIAPYDGYYFIYATAATASVAATAGQLFGLSVFYNNINDYLGPYDAAYSTTSRPYSAQVSQLLFIPEGTPVEIQFSENLPAVNMNNNVAYNNLSIMKVG